MYFLRGIVLWINLGLLCLVIALATGLASLLRPQLWTVGRSLVPFALQIAGVFLVTWLLVQRGQSLAATLPPPPEQQNAVWAHVLAPAIASLELIAVAMVLGTGIGTAIAYVTARARSGRLAVTATIASLVWIVPAFLIAILVQDAQAAIYAFSGTNVSGSYGQAGPNELLWCAVVLAIRPAAYTFRQGHVLIGDQSRALHVRTAFAKGLPWNEIVSRHIIRPAAAGLIQTSINSLRLVVGLLPLVEFFFGYPGLGRLLLLSLGVPSAADQAPQPEPTIAVACAVLLALLLVLTELPLRLAARRLDPRLAEA